jgi:DNA-binding MurR/RpiR family transcriptional regulator
LAGEGMSSLLKTLKNKDFLSSSEVLIAEYLVKNYRDVANLSTRELAKKTFTSSAAIVRFCQKLGFEGYVDFKLKFLLEMNTHSNEVQARLILEHDNLETVMSKVREINIDAINTAYNNLNPVLLVKVLKRIVRATCVDFYAMDSFKDCANRIAESFLFFNKHSTVSNSMALQYLQAYGAPKNHLGFFIDPIGENRMLVDIAKILKSQDCPMVLITASPKSELARLVNEYFTVKMGDNIEDLGDSVFLSSAKYIADTLFAALIAKTNYKEALGKEFWLNEKFCY